MVCPVPGSRGRSCVSVKGIVASALAAIVFNEPSGVAIAALIRGCELVALNALAYEMANVCLVKIRRRSAPRDTLRTALAMPGPRIETVTVDPRALLPLVEATGLTIYDCSYLWLARELGVDLVSLDRELAAATGSMR